MARPDWRVAGATGLVIGLTIGGFSLVSASPPGPAVAPNHLRFNHPPLPPHPSPGELSPLPGLSPAPADPAVSPASPDVVAPPVISERATPRPTPRPTPVVDSDSVASAASSD